MCQHNFHAGNILSFIVLLLAPNWWMSRIVHMSLQEQASLFSVGIFGGLVGGAFVLSIVRNFSFVSAILRSSRKLHNRMTEAVIKSPVLFFDTNSSGRIMNRFSKDIGAMDDILAINFLYAMTLLSNIVAIILLTICVNVWIVVPIIPIMTSLYYIVRYYLNSAREIKRMEAIRCSPVYAHVAETIAGLEVIRTTHMEKDFCNKMYRYI